MSSMYKPNPWVMFSGKDGVQDIDQLLKDVSKARNQDIYDCKIIQQFFWMANQHFQFNLSWNGLIYENRYSPDNGNHNWHRDEQFITTGPHRKLSMVIQLTDPNDYEGGNFEFVPEIPKPTENTLRQRGTVLVFPSYIKHRAAPVTKGQRSSLAAWVEGPGFT